MFDIKYHLKTNMSKMKLNLDESYEEYTTEELQLLDKFQEYSKNIFDDNERRPGKHDLEQPLQSMRLSEQ